MQPNKNFINLLLCVILFVFGSKYSFGIERENDIIKRIYLKISLDSISNIQNERLREQNYDAYWNYEDHRLNFIAQLEGTLSISYCEHLGGASYMAANLNNINSTIRYGLEYEKIATQLNLIFSSNNALVMGAISWAYWKLGNYDKAIEYGYKEINVHNAMNDWQSQDILNAYKDLRTKLFFVGHITEAIKLCQEQLFRLHECNVDNNELLFEIKSFLCEMYFNVRDYDKAKNTIYPYLNDTKKTEYKRYAYRMMGNYFFLTNNIPSAINYYTYCLDLSKNDKFELACCYEGLANCYNRQGDIAKYNYYTLLGNKFFKEILDPTNWDILVSDKNLANMYEGLGNNQKAIEIMEEVCRTAEKGWLCGSRRHIEMANRLIKLLIVETRYERALQTITKIKQYLIQNYGYDSDDYASLIIKEAECLHHLGNSSEAKDSLLSIDTENLNCDSNVYFNYYNILSCVGIQLKDANMSKMAVEKMTNYVINQNGIDKYLGLSYIGYIYYLIGDYNRAAQLYRDAMNGIRQNGIEYLMNYSPNNQLSLWTKYLHTLKREIPHVGNLICNQIDFTDVLYDALLYSKGLLYTTEHLWKRCILNSGDNDIITKMYRMMQLNDIVTKDSFEGSNGNERTELLELQIELCNYVKNNIRKYKNAFTSFADLQKNLHDEDMCIEFSLYQDETGEWSFCALLLNNTIDKPMLIRLCKKSQIESMSHDLIYNSDELWHLIWKQIEPYLSNIKNIYFSPDDILNSIAIEYIHDDNMKIMNEKFNMYRLSSTSEILNNNKSDKKSIIIMGGFDFDCNELENSEHLVYEDETLRTALIRHHRFTSLTSSKVEVERIASLFDMSGRKSVLVTGRDGTVECFNSISGASYDIIHIATHGFYIMNDSIKFDDDKVLLQSGLVFAGINSMIRANSDTPLPIVTAFDLTALNLSKIGFVVLSACQTGLGDIKEDGVFGLQRGFKRAGVHSLLLSLWNVDDDATQLLMTEFYKYYLNGMSKREALLTAQKAVRETPGFEDPEYWAAFILLDALN